MSKFDKRIPEPFKTAKGTLLRLIDFQGKDYMETSQRLRWFREDHPDGIINTEVLENNGTACTVKATILVWNERTKSYTVLATGHKRLLNADFPRGPLEKGETQAIGRAVAAAGYGIQFEPEFDEEDDGIIADAPQERNHSVVSNTEVSQGKSTVRPKGSPVKQHSPGTGITPKSAEISTAPVPSPTLSTTATTSIRSETQRQGILATAKNRPDVDNLLSSVSRVLAARDLLSVPEIKRYMLTTYNTDDKSKLTDEQAEQLLTYLDSVNNPGSDASLG